MKKNEILLKIKEILDLESEDIIDWKKIEEISLKLSAETARSDRIDERFMSYIDDYKIRQQVPKFASIQTREILNILKDMIE